MADDITSSILGNFEKEASDIRRGAPARDVFNTEANISQFTDRTQPREPLPSMPEPTMELRQGKPEDETKAKIHRFHELKAGKYTAAGVKPEDLEKLYQHELKKNPELTVEEWAGVAAL